MKSSEYKKIRFVKNEEKEEEKLESQILVDKKIFLKIIFKELGDKLNLNTKKDLKILKTSFP